MRPFSATRWAPPAATAVLWALAAGSALFWGLRLSGPASAPAYAPIAASEAPDADAGALGRVLGAVRSEAPQAAPAASRFVLLGVLADVSSGGGAALLAVDGQPARPFRVGSTVAPGYVLQSVGRRRAVLGATGSAALTVDMPVLK
ncbi:MAG: type II secretion system protein N [Pseudomonadota bacterium]